MSPRATPHRSSADPPAIADPRLHVLADAPAPERAQYVLYWCRAYRRAQDNLALDHAVARANELGLPLLAYESLDPRYPHANDRLHTFVLEGACEMREALAARNVAYAFYLPRTREEAHASRALARLAERAALVVTDWYPPAGGPRSLWAHDGALARTLGRRFEAYDDAAVVPLATLQKHEIAARTIRPKVHALLDASLASSTDRAVRAGLLRALALPFEPTVVTREGIAALVASCAIDHGVPAVRATPGGAAEAARRLARFLNGALREGYDARNDMARTAGSGLSAHLHFGQLSPRAVARAARAAHAPEALREKFLEELVVRRALAFNHALSEPLHAEYAGAPAWARATLEAHERDPRAGTHTRDEWETARTAEPLWNAAQRELLRDGVIHPYARMLWGKVALTLAARPADAFAWLVYLNDKYALDGRDPNSYANIGWCFGLHDHPFPTRPVFGQVRSMTARSAANKWDTAAYVARVERSEILESAAPSPAKPSHRAVAKAARTRRT